MTGAHSQSGHRGHRRCLKSGQQGRGNRDHHSHHHPQDDGAGLHHQIAAGEGEAKQVQRLPHAVCQENPRTHSQRRRHQPHHGSLGGHHPDHLTGGGSDGPEERQFPESLRHDNAEGVLDDEGAHQDGHRREHQEGGVEEPQAGLQFFDHRLLQLFTGGGGQAFGQDGFDPLQQHLGGDPLFGAENDGGEPSLQSHQALGLPVFEEEQGTGPEVGLAHRRGQAHYPKAALSVLEGDIYLLTDRNAVSRGRSGIHRHLPRAGGRSAIGFQDGEPVDRGIVDPREAEFRGSRDSQEIAFRIEQLSEAAHRRHRCLHAGNRSDLIQ